MKMRNPVMTKATGSDLSLKLFGIKSKKLLDIPFFVFMFTAENKHPKPFLLFIS